MSALRHKVLSVREFLIAKKMLKKRSVRAQRELTALLESFNDDGSDGPETHRRYVAMNKAMAEARSKKAAMTVYHVSKFVRKNR
mmetsp:Transcript_1696/g.7407  ORF Transcript_1696/g.7407 Transcript_1696/m.7407 type:complete len:84 (+) Transcript_1696:176-427(+)